MKAPTTDTQTHTINSNSLGIHRLSMVMSGWRGLSTTPATDGVGCGWGTPPAALDAHPAQLPLPLLGSVGPTRPARRALQQVTVCRAVCMRVASPITSQADRAPNQHFGHFD